MLFEESRKRKTMAKTSSIYLNSLVLIESIAQHRDPLRYRLDSPSLTPAVVTLPAAIFRADLDLFRGFRYGFLTERQWLSSKSKMSASVTTNLKR